MPSHYLGGDLGNLEGIEGMYADYTGESPFFDPTATAASTAAAAAAPTLDYTQFGIDPEYIRSPAQAFRIFGTGFRPGWQRQAFYTQQPQLTQQYLMGLPESPQSFQEFLGGYGQIPQLGGAEMRTRAGEIASLQGLSQADWLAYLGELGEGEGVPDYATSLTPGQQATYRDIYGPGSENVVDLARTLALQRGTGIGQYQGILGQAIGNVIDDLYTQYMGENPGGNFLEWYLERSAPGGRLRF